MDVSIAQMAGLQPSKPSKFAPLGTKRFFTGLYTSRSPLMEPGSRASQRFYGGRPDALWDGLNVEISVDNTLIRRPGFSVFNTLASNPTSFYTFRSPIAPIRVLADTATTVYNVPSPGSATAIFTKGTGAGPTRFQAVGATVFMADGVDLLKWDGTHLWNWGIAAPVAAPSLTIKAGAPPAVPTLAATAGGTLTSQGTMYVRVTFVTAFGETNPSGESFLAIPDNNELVVSAPTNAPSTATGWNCYIGKSSGGETLQNTTAIALGVNYTLTAAPTITGAACPGSLTGTYTATSMLGIAYVYCYRNSTTDHTSTASPVSAQTGPQTSVSITIAGIGSTDPQVSTVDIYRTVDGGATYLLLASIANSANWQYVDPGTPDLQLNADVVAPQAMSNNPPPAGLTNIAYFAGCIFGSVGNYLYYSNGPNTTNGSGNESFPPLNYALLPSQITRLVPYPNGLFIFTVDDLYYLNTPGGTPVIYQAGLGCLSYDAIDMSGSSIYVFTSDNNVLQVNPGAGVVDLGFSIAGLLASWNPANVSVAYQIFGHNDNALFICDGSGDMFRCNPSQQPEGGHVWGTKATIAAGASVIASVETTAGVHRLLVGSGTNILFRDWTVNADNGVAYSAWVTIGSLVFALPGQICEIQSLTIEAMRVGNLPTVAVLLNEVSGTFESVPTSVQDPPFLPASTSLYSNRFYLDQTQIPIVCRHLMFQVSFGTDTVANELLSYSFYGCLHVDQ